MQPLKALNNVQKARLLHSLLMTEIPDFLSYLYEFTERLLEEREQVAATWKDQLFSADFWFDLAGEVKGKAERYANELKRSPVVFSEQLFGGYPAIYTVHVLLRYADEQTTDPKFSAAVHLFFNP